MSDEPKRPAGDDDGQAAKPASDELGADVWAVSYGDEDDRELDTSQVQQALRSGEIGPSTLVWRPGMPTWRPLEKVDALSGLVSAPRAPRQTRKPKVESRTTQSKKKSSSKKAKADPYRKPQAPATKPAPAHAPEREEPTTVMWLPLFIAVAALLAFWFTRGQPGQPQHAVHEPGEPQQHEPRTREPQHPVPIAGEPHHATPEAPHNAEPAPPAPVVAPPAPLHEPAEPEHAAHGEAPAASAAANPAPSAAPEPSAVAAGVSAFDKLSALRAFVRQSTKVARCRSRAEPEGTAHVNLTIDPSGQIKEAKVVDAAYIGTPTAKCIQTRVKDITLPPFSGEAVTLRVPVTLF